MMKQRFIRNMRLAEPDLRVVRMVAPICELANRVRRSESFARVKIGRWESEVEAFNLLLLSASLALATVKLAKSSISFLPSTDLNARAAMEAGAKALWLLQPDDPFEREGRWLIHLESEANIRNRLGKHSKKEAENAANISAFADAVRARLPADTPALGALPKFDKMLEAVGLPEKYIAYPIFSQFTHATHYAGGLFRRHLGSQKEFGEFAKAKGWWLPLSIQWWFLAVPAEKLAERAGIGELLVPNALSTKFIRAQDELGNPGGPT